jgi:hypothetical protein
MIISELRLAKDKYFSFDWINCHVLTYGSYEDGVLHVTDFQTGVLIGCRFSANVSHWLYLSRERFFVTLHDDDCNATGLFGLLYY